MDVKQLAYELGFENYEKATPLKLFKWICLEDKINLRNDLSDYLGKDFAKIVTEKLIEYKEDGSLTFPNSWRVKKKYKAPKEDKRSKNKIKKLKPRLVKKQDTGNR
ncbi:hypothetical protein AB4428_11765 [Vibrio lentus]